MERNEMEFLVLLNPYVDIQHSKSRCEFATTTIIM